MLSEELDVFGYTGVRLFNTDTKEVSEKMILLIIDEIMILLIITRCFNLGCQWNNVFTSKEIFIVAALIGFGGATMLIISLSITADLVGQDTESSAFIYGAMSLLDKLSNGVLNKCSLK